MDAFFFHPKLVHIPMALAVLMPLVAGGLSLSWIRGWLQPRAWVLAVALQGVLLVSGIVALRSGEAEEHRVERVVPEHYIEAHEEAAEVFVGTGGAVLGLMAVALAFARHPLGRRLAVTASLGTLVVAGLGYRTGAAGGALVYRHGAAAAYVGEGGPTPATGAGRAGNRAHDGDDYDDDDD